MNKKEKIELLIEKYEPILTHSIKLTLAEDLVNLIIANQDDKDFELTEFIKDKSEFKEFVFKKYFKRVSKHPLEALSTMNEPFKMKSK